MQPNENTPALSVAGDGKPVMSSISTSGRSTGRLKAFFSVETLQILGLIAVILAISFGMQANFPRFLHPLNLEIMTVNFVPEAIIALGMTIVIITGGIDLSVAGVYPFAAIVVSKLLVGGVPIPLAIVLTIVIAAGVGAINAFMTNTFKVHPFIATLATLLTLRGVNLVITDGATVSGLPAAFKAIGKARLIIGDAVNIPLPLLVAAVLAVMVGYLLANNRFFQQAYFIGGNKRSARMSGIKVERYLYFVFMFSAALAGVAGVLAASQLGAASNSYGQNMELRVITAVVIGGASLSGGVGTILGTTLGVLFLAIVYNAFAMTGISTYWQDVVIGVMLLIAVFLSEFLKRRRLAR
ncbi:MAG: ABC transporter permease [Anaerolineae bacterium]|nr:ABC transporter permease [Anaerolineae bacterium]